MVKNMDDLCWSSYLATVGKHAAPDWLEMNGLLSHFGKQRKRARVKYINLVRKGIGLPSIWGNLQHQVYLGNENFINKQQKAIKQKDSLEDIPCIAEKGHSKTIRLLQGKYKDRNRAIAEVFLLGGYTMKRSGIILGGITQQSVAL